MRVLLVNKFWYPKGGSERYAFLLKNLLESEGHEVVPFGMADARNIATPWAQHFAPHVDFWGEEHPNTPRRTSESSNTDPNTSNAPRVRLGATSAIGKFMSVLWNRDAAACLDGLLEIAKPDVAHLQNFAHQLSPSLLPVLRKHGVPIVWTLHDYKALCPNYRMYTKGLPCERCKGHSFVNALRYNCMGSVGASATVAAEMYLHHSLMNVYGKHINTVIAPSAFLAEKLVEWGWKGRVAVVPNFLVTHDSERVLSPNTPTGAPPMAIGVRAAGAPRSVPPVRNRAPAVLFVGRLVEEKGVEDFCDAAARLAHIPFAVIGSGPMGRRLANVEWRGARPPEETAAAIASARMLVVPSRWYENAPYVVLEAMAAGIPVIASAIGGLPELVRDGATGVLVPPRDAHALANAVEMLYSDPSRARALGAHAREVVRTEYGPTRHYNRLTGIYEALTAQ